MSVVYLKQTEDGKLKKITSLEDADYVRMPVALYRKSFEKHECEEVVRIQREEYNGLKKMLRIIRDRELQLIEKEKADEHGYTTKYVDERVYDRSKPDIKAEYIIKTTPVSLKIDLLTAATMIKSDLQEFYGFMDEQYFMTSAGIKKEIKAIDLLAAFKQKIEKNDDRDFYVYDSEYGRKLKEIIDSSEALSFGPIKLSANVGQGVYEVTYWGTVPV